MDIQIAREKIIEKIKQTEEKGGLRSILKFLDINAFMETEAGEWQQGTSASLSMAYGEDEPDYEDIIIKEPNPDYSVK
ncbi:MAG: hypothetical protein H6573_06620 [Lewinellaceae bacterium]|nr:hypothetical protein [Phaeodactylibacter sp.]MCB9347176.1 hypothetical protein [Lewinellaceae bacterium]